MDTVKQTTELAKQSASVAGNKVAEMAEDTGSKAAALAGVVSHGAQQKQHELQAAYYRSQVTKEGLNPHEHKEAAKAALEHTFAARDEALAKAHCEEDAGLREAGAKISEMTEKAKESIAPVAGRVVESAKETASATGERVQALGSAALHGSLEKKEALQEAYYKGRATDYALPTEERKEAAKSALEHHIVGREHGFQKELAAEESGVPALPDTVKAGFTSAAESTQRAAEVVKAKSLEAAHIAKEKVVEGAQFAKEKTIEGAQFAKEKTIEGAQIVRRKSAEGVDLVKEKTAAGAQSVRDTASATAEAMKHSTLAAKEELQAKYYASKATQETITPHERKEAAKSALEHHLAAKEHRELTEEAKERAGLNTLGDKTSAFASTAKEGAAVAASYAAVGASRAGEIIKEGAEKAAEYMQPVIAPVKDKVSGLAAGISNTASEKKHELQAGYYQGQAVSTANTGSERMEAAKAALEHERQATIAGSQETAIGSAMSRVTSTLAAIPELLSGAFSSGAGAVSAQAHRALAAKESWQESSAQEAAVDSNLSPRDRKEAAKAALEHHQAAAAHIAATQRLSGSGSPADKSETVAALNEIKENLPRAAGVSQSATSAS
jgi:hypothetical protein